MVPLPKTLGDLQGFKVIHLLKWLDDVTDWAKTELPRVVNLAEDRSEFRMFIHGIVQAPHGV